MHGRGTEQDGVRVASPQSSRSVGGGASCVASAWAVTSSASTSVHPCAVLAELAHAHDTLRQRGRRSDALEGRLSRPRGRRASPLPTKICTALYGARTFAYVRSETARPERSPR
jgi:hypothetical protein